MDATQIVIDRTAAERKILDVVNEFQRKTGVQATYISLDSGERWDQPQATVPVVPKDAKSVRLEVRLP